MRKNTFLAKTLAIILFTVVLSATLTAAVFNYSGRMVFSSIKASELVPRAKYLASTSADFLEGVISKKSYERAIGSGYHIWDSAMYAYDYEGVLFAFPSRSDNELNTKIISQYIDQVLSGENIYSPNTKNKAGVVIGEPIKNSSGNVIGALFLVKPLNELNAALESLFVALIISMVAATAIMIIPAYIGSRNIAKPILQMNATANAMANGDFSVKASVEGTDEIAQLGHSLNHLSAALYATISDLTLEKNRLHAVLNGLGEGILAINSAGDIIKINSAALHLFGGSENDDVTSLAPYKQCLGDIQLVLGGQTSAEREINVRDRTLRIAMTSLMYEGKNDGAVMLIRDITEAARLEQTRIEYVANVSHELRTPIASIRGLADALNDGLVTEEADRLRYYGYILRESMRLSRLIDDLLELSRLQSGAVALSKQDISVEELIYDVADRFAASASEKGIELKTSVGEGCESAYTNPDRAEQVLVALLDNAIKHGGNTGSIALSAQRQGDKLRISVSNPGSISENDIEHVFERFYKVDKSHSGSGTGLGLSIVKEVLELMDENISVTCENGIVTFAFTLSALRGE